MLFIYLNLIQLSGVISWFIRLHLFHIYISDELMFNSKLLDPVIELTPSMEPDRIHQYLISTHETSVYDIE